MAENKEAVRERVRRFRELKKKIGVTVTDVTQEAKSLPPVTESLPNDFDERLFTLEHAIVDLQTRISRLENPDGVTRKQALKPGSRPNELYGA